jgi:hypothetical protein
MNSFTNFFCPSLPRNYEAELEAINAKIDAAPGVMADYDQRSEILFHLGNAQAAIMDFETATSLEPDGDRKELRNRELTDMRRRYS